MAMARRLNKLRRMTMMGLPNWLRPAEEVEDVDLTVPATAKVEPRLSKGGNFMPVDTGEDVDPMKSPPFPIGGPVGKKPSDDDAAAVVAQAHSYIEQWKLERVTQTKIIDALHIDLAELTLQLEGERRKIAALELDLNEAHNNLQTQQTQIYEYQKFMSVWKQMHDKTGAVFDKFNVQAPPKRERTPHPKKALADGSLPGDREKKNAETSAPKDDRKTPDQAAAKVEPMVSKTATKQTKA
jgi:hypothetical protein